VFFQRRPDLAIAPTRVVSRDCPQAFVQLAIRAAFCRIFGVAGVCVGLALRLRFSKTLSAARRIHIPAWCVLKFSITCAVIIDCSSVGECESTTATGEKDQVILPRDPPEFDDPFYAPTTPERYFRSGSQTRLETCLESLVHY